MILIVFIPKYRNRKPITTCPITFNAAIANLVLYKMNESKMNVEKVVNAPVKPVNKIILVYSDTAWRRTTNSQIKPNRKQPNIFTTKTPNGNGPPASLVIRADRPKRDKVPKPPAQNIINICLTDTISS